MNTILLIDDEEKLRSLMARILSLEGFNIIQAENIKTAWKKIALQEIDVVVCDVKLPDGSGLNFSRALKEKFPAIEIILLTAYGNIPDGVQAIKNNAFDYITKGDDNNKIIPLLYKAVEKVNLTKRILQLEQQVGKKYSFENILGKSKAILQSVALAEKVAKTDATVLLLGETGTGKEVFAQAIHFASDRNNKPFVAINCSAFSKDLLESELFGHKAGSFTGATKDKKGLFEEANKGTIFLDEIGEMAVELQAKLLRVLESGEFIKIGETTPSKVNVRIIAATNRDLSKEIELGNFREDLYYRLSVFTIEIPALRDRKQDIPELANYFAEIFIAKTNKRSFKLSKEYLQALENHSWKGNIRELKNVIERSVILNDKEVLSIDSLPYELQHSSNNSQKTLSAFSLNSAEKLHIQKVLNHTQGNKAEAARLLEIGIATLYRKIEEYKLQ
ncbi:sigma-54-dependent transcriptional regulator [Arachidicoccus soli]|uniref:Sigma-54-dependent Fis family transcriptional regulator n=1 Tax=Arachidicoccus soli TaxID=2341117 RepID=A0A386HR67_9BACT|nr:sigma-54 dependent transcriptional regulator [Arachidicoccus soli]AYD48273.1 sigma-54-dependent Fis family transcriptional regulator [Arachidicoccus soli]